MLSLVLAASSISVPAASTAGCDCGSTDPSAPCTGNAASISYAGTTVPDVSAAIATGGKMPTHAQIAARYSMPTFDLCGSTWGWLDGDGHGCGPGGAPRVMDGMVPFSNLANLLVPCNGTRAR